MTQLIRNYGFKAFVAVLVMNMLTFAAWAQDSGGSSTTTTTTTRNTSVTTEAWYTSPWVWVVGAAVFILLLIALLRGGGSDRTGRTDRVTVTKTTSTDV